MVENRKSSSGGIGFIGPLAILFIALKLTEYIAWSWWWVLAPIWLAAIHRAVIFICAVALKAREES